MKSGKIWGSTELLFKNENFEVHRIMIHPNCKCSKHKHQYKHNMFYVESGTLEIKVWKNEYPLIDDTILNEGEKMSISPGEFHQFSTGNDSVIAYEIYFSEPISGDIIRETSGGKCDL